MSDEKLQQDHKITTAKSSTIPSVYSGIPFMGMVDQGDVVLQFQTVPKDIILDLKLVSSKESSTTINTDQSLTNPTFKVSVNGSGAHEEISDIPSTSTPIVGTLSLVECSTTKIQTTQNLLLFEFPRAITMISSIPTDLMQVFCIPCNIMSPCVQPRIDYELQFKIFNALNILRNTKFIYGPNLVNILPRIDHLKYSMKICYDGKHLSPSIDVFKITSGTQVTSTFKLKCAEKVLITKQNINGFNLYYPYVKFQ
ncbi:uncharacterized protein LOC112596592 [Melanaphis sacchari]|uniref:uncharacterized protein LOC112596592 n=1 Tax=Melanaphis sacchari TaxID=742174 RepID=UPI000DC136E5|nr:uncharacterized protein LOC112596592 [Melanaphis sacchari]